MGRKEIAKENIEMPVTFTFGCVDIKIDSKSKIARLDGCERFNFSGIQKQFPNVRELHIGKQVKQIVMDNSLFPNIKKVVSESEHFVSDTNVLINIRPCNDDYDNPEDKPKMVILKNVFCKKEGEKIDLAGVQIIAENAFADCKTHNVVNTESVWMCQRNAFPESYRDTFGYDEKDIIVGTILVKPFTKKGQKEYMFPDANITCVQQDIMLPVVQTVVVRHEKEAKLLFDSLRRVENNIETLRFATNGTIDFQYLHSKTSLWPWLQNIEFSSENPYYKSIDGILYSSDGKRLVVFPDYRRQEIVRLPEGLEEIDSDAFYMTTEVKELHSNM